MSKFFTVLSLLLRCVVVISQNNIQNYTINYFDKIATEKHEEIIKIAFNNDGSYYICGHNGGPIIIQDITQQQTGANISIFLAYFNNNDKCVWIKTFGSDYVDYVKSLCVDDNKNVYLVGAFSGNSMVFDNITLNNTRPWYYDLFVVKVSSTGQVLWAKGNDLIFSYPVMDNEAIVDCAIDKNNDLVIVGVSKSTNYNDITSFVAKISCNGEKRWIKYIQSDGYKVITSCSVNQEDYIYIAGSFSGYTLNLDSITISSCSSHQNGFIARLDSTGNFIDAKRINEIRITAIGGTTQENLWNFSKNIFVKTFNSNKVLIAAQILEGANPSIDSLVFYNITTSPYPANFLIAEFDNNFNVKWGRTSASYINTFIKDLDIDSSGSIFICGNVDGRVLYYNNQVAMGHYVSDGNSAYIACLDSSGIFKLGYLSRNIDLDGTVGGENNYGITCAVFNNNVIMGGNFCSDTIYFDNHSLSNCIYSYYYQGFYGYANSSDIYLLKLIKDNDVGELPFCMITVYPNPVENEINFIGKENLDRVLQITLMELNGRVLCNWIDFNDNKIVLPSDISDGLYLLEVKTKTIKYWIKVIIKK